MTENPYKQLAQRLDTLPNGFPATPSGSELRLLAKLYSPEEAALTACLRLTAETPAQLAARIGGDPGELRQQLKGMARRGLITAERVGNELGYRLLPFVVGIYEMQVDTLDAELARLFEDYFQEAYSQAMAIQPPVHRVIPVNETVRIGMEIRPFESAAEIVHNAKAWGMLDCICRKQKALIGQPCKHPADLCMTFSDTPGAFDHNPTIRALTYDESLAALRRAAEAGLVHSVSNNQRGLWYICNCCTCSCGVLRGIAEMGLANAVARSAFVNRVDETRCNTCGSCVEMCQFDALAMGMMAVEINEIRCVGCGVCVIACPEGALTLVRRPEDEILPPPETDTAWREARAKARGVDLSDVL